VRCTQEDVVGEAYTRDGIPCIYTRMYIGEDTSLHSMPPAILREKQHLSAQHASHHPKEEKAPLCAASSSHHPKEEKHLSAQRLTLHPKKEKHLSVVYLRICLPTDYRRV